jgi:hypothetical protein
VTDGEHLTLTVEATDGRREDKVLAVYSRSEEDREPEPES